MNLVSDSAELALDLLEKNGVLVPFCRLQNQAQEISIIAADDEEATDFNRAAISIRIELKQQISTGSVAQFAFCSDVWIKLQNELNERRFLKIEFQNGMPDSVVYLFPLTIDNGKAQLSSYLLTDLPEKLL